MRKEVGYVVSVLGIVVMAVGFGMIPVDLDILNLVDSNYVAGVGILLVVFGVFVSLEKKKGNKKRTHKDGEDEVPIYEGTGKNRKVVGYRKD